MLRAAPLGRHLGVSVSFPVDTSSRAFRRARSETNFPIEKLDRDSVSLKHAPIELRWRSTHVPTGSAVGVGDADIRVKLPEVRVHLAVDPHKSGYGDNSKADSSRGFGRPSEKRDMRRDRGRRFWVPVW